jgi:hypothetical protein
LSWVPDERYKTSRNLAHRLGVNAFFCALAEASRALDGHCLASWRPEHWVRTRAAEVKPDGFGRYLHTGGACEFYLEYDRGTEAFAALAQKLEGYLKLAAGWTKEQELTGLPNLLILVPEEEREEDVASAFRSAVVSRCASDSLASSFPLFVANACRSWTSRPAPVTSTGPRGASAATSPTTAPVTAAASPPLQPRPDSAPCRPDMLLEAAR